jgi:hypothetical protein
VREPDLIRTAIASLLLVTASVCLQAAEGPPVAKPPVARVALERVAGDPVGNQKALQFLEADAKGRVFLLHGDTLEVEQILPSGRIVTWRTPHGKEASDAAVTDAALSPDGSSWLLASGPDEISLLSGDEHRQLPPPQW